MKRFKFQLETVLAERKRIEDHQLREWTLGKRFLQRLLDELATLELGLEEAISKATELASSPGVENVGMFGALDAFISGQKLRIVWKSQEIEKGTKIVERKRAEYVVARQRREALEKLRERKLHEFNEEQRKREARELDDIYIMNGAAQRRSREEEEGLVEGIG